MTDIYDPLVQDQKFLNEIKYSARDFASIADDLLRRLKIEYGDVYNDYASTNLGIMLRDLVAWAYAGISWYLDRNMSDCYLETARTRSAVERIVSQLEYKMGSAAASGASLLLTFPNGTTDAFAMWARWRYSGAGGLIFEAISQVNQTTALNPGDTIAVSVRQGETKTVSYTGNGRKNQEYRLTNVLDDYFLSNGSVEVWVDGQLWEERPFLEFTKDNHYEVSYLSEPPIVRFGDGIAGNIPPVGAEVKIRYVVTSGEMGNVKSNAITSSIDTLVIGSETVSFTVTNPDRATGGVDPEAIEKAKKWAPSNFAARNSAITRPDYEVLVNRFVDPSYGAVAKGYAVCPRLSSGDAELQRIIGVCESILSSFVTNSNSYVSNINAYASTLDGIVSSINDASSIIDGSRSSVESNIIASMSQVESARMLTVDASSYAGAAANLSSSAMSAAESLRDSVSTGSVSTDEIIEMLDDIIYRISISETNAEGAMTSALSAGNAISNSVSPKLQDVLSEVEDGGAMSSGISSVNAGLTSLSLNVDLIEYNAGMYNGMAGSLSSSINSELNDIDSHITNILNDDCKTNYVQVPILATDLSGNYAAPSLGLMRSLQQYLDGIKEVTQVVEVIDGSSILVSADISVSIRVGEAYVFDEVKSQIESAVIGLLKGRDFNSSLYLSDLYEVVKLCKGVDYANIEIAGTGTTSGNLLTKEYQVVVLGSLSVIEV